MDRLDAMRVLLTVVDAGSLSAAARRLGTPLPTVSRKMAELERHLGTQLLVRTSRRIAVTDAGTAYVAASRAILDRVEEAERLAAGEYTEPRGQLAITAPVVFGRRHVWPLAAAFLEQHPKIDLRLALLDRHVDLVEEHLDLGIRIGHLEDSTLVARKVGSVRRVICASPGYLARHGIPQQPADLAAHRGVTFHGFANEPGWRFRGDNSALLEPRTRVAVNSIGTAIDAAIAGMGVVRLLSYQARQAIGNGELVEVLAPFSPDPLPVQIIHSGQDRLPMKARMFADWIAPKLSEMLKQ